MAELADARDLKSRGRKAVWVRSPPPALNRINHLRARLKRFTVASYLSVLESLPEPVIASLADSLRQMADHLPAPLLPDVEP